MPRLCCGIVFNIVSWAGERKLGLGRQAGSTARFAALFDESIVSRGLPEHILPVPALLRPPFTRVSDGCLRGFPNSFYELPVASPRCGIVN
ncbi:hypothetical protein MPTK1_2g22720 [Marchantia polymorpha subsp. ruderalis]|uniref:Uncharacterized protein n=1 Tax=Marchantia polymorpha TaxID=3197 RepID=A0A2R6WN94_MARPO|nr:hypothetical protein MARPO_0072s0059 [Marchantia polymorpha]BBN03335.1 hypothetical protein Mp_2g22720 [Marchantia polymorpha subsp. ruderalis]|eukprot:PTQ35316.1 hypothetical protein MARPO_0072s0059 [Marchantia polymorpha]